ncbi:inositol monophosphatase [Aureimonas sp. AU12]|uniref:inositol monophosphatase family protein n=1 Tax=Aureimonas sp. AU12 TaxID=1638161 RepID=UPI0007843414|nr:inositol monophosphatase [Aureimonas sp. AU12]
MTASSLTAADLDARFAFAQDLAAEAGDLALSYFRRLETLTVRSKGLQDMASEADVEVEQMIRSRIAAAYPSDAFLGEETGRTEFTPGQGIWVVDPIDGTQPFVNGMTAWCVSIAFVEGGRNRFGVVDSPARGERFAGGAGRGATLNSRPIAVRPAVSVREGLLALGYSPRVTPAAFIEPLGRILEAGGMFTRDGSGALSLAYVACGRLLGYAEPHINSWDCLGAMAVIEGAGGRVSDFLGGEGLWSGNPLLAASPELYPELERLYLGR